MGLITKQITIDFYNQKYVLINAKQYDELSRYILVTCLNQGEKFFVDKENNFAYIRYKKADGFNVFNQCEITDDGKLLVELTPQMLADVGRCYADLVLIHKNFDNSEDYEYVDDLFDVSFSDDGKGNVILYTSDFIEVNDEDDGEVIIETMNLSDAITEGKYSVVSTMAFCVYVSAAVVDNQEIESTNEYNALNDLLIKANENYTAVITACKTYKESAALSDANADESESNAKLSEENAKISEVNAKTSEQNAKVSETNAEEFATNAKESEDNAIYHATLAFNKANESSESASLSMENAEIAKNYATESENSALLAQSYAIGGTNIRTNENIDNAKYYYSHTKAISDSLGGTFSPQGTIQFADLQTVEKEVGYVYHVEDEFTTDETFKKANVTYPAGTNVYWTANGYWDCFISTMVDNELVDSLNKTLIKLQTYVDELENRIAELESQVVLGIVE